MKVTEQIKNRFKDKIEISEKSKKRIYAAVSKEHVKEVVRYLFSDMGARFSIATGIDTRLGVEILYHMAFDKDGVIVSVRTMVEKPELEIPTFTDIIPGANWIERELHEMFGVNFIGHPGLDRLLLPDDWEAGVYPFRKKTFESEKENLER
jgi:NADH:ubiquinone oxidoreductase subunit C